MTAIGENDIDTPIRRMVFLGSWEKPLLTDPDGNVYHDDMDKVYIINVMINGVPYHYSMFVVNGSILRFKDPAPFQIHADAVWVEALPKE